MLYGIDSTGPRKVCCPPTRLLISCITSLARSVRSSTILLTKMAGMAISRARKLTTSSLIPMERDRSRIRALKGRAEVWLKDASSIRHCVQYHEVLYIVKYKSSWSDRLSHPLFQLALRLTPQCRVRPPDNNPSGCWEAVGGPACESCRRPARDASENVRGHAARFSSAGSAVQFRREAGD